MAKTRVSPRRTTIAVLAVASAVGFAGCSAGGAGGSQQDVLTVAASAAVTTWDPVRSFSTEALYLGNIYEPLLWKNPEGSAEPFRPGIAQSWQASDDGLEWTFTIRDGATFHDGEPVDADAVVASVEAAVDHAAASFIWAPLDSVTAADESTVVMKLKYPAPMDLISASTYGAWIVSPKALKASADNKKYFEEGVDAGTGPYTLAEYDPGSKVVLKAYDDYWDKKAAPNYGVVDIAITPDAVTAQQMMTAGEVDFATSLPLENVDDVAKQLDAEVRTSNSPFNFVGFFNTTRPPLDDPKVRQALSYAIPYQDIIEVGGQGYGTQSFGPVPRGIFPFSENVPQYQQDLDKAAALLAEAGHADGLKLSLSYASENPSEARFVPLIKDAFAKIGVKLDVRAELFNQQWENAKSDPENAQDIFVVYYWPTYSDAGSDNLFSLFHSSDEPNFNLSYWKNDAYDALVDEAAKLTGTDRDAAQAKYEEATTLLADQAPGIFFYDVQSVTVSPPGLDVPAYNENYPFTTFFAPITPAD